MLDNTHLTFAKKSYEHVEMKSTGQQKQQLPNSQAIAKKQSNLFGQFSQLLFYFLEIECI